jgi:hypothetical protein
MTEHRTSLSDRDRIALAGLADGTLRGRRRAGAEARLRALSDGAALLERQRRVRRALRDGPAPVPAQPVVAATRSQPQRRTRRWTPAAALAGAGAAAIAALLLVLVLVQPGGRPLVAQAADLATQPATAAAPASAGRTLRAQVDGVRFPDWSDEFGWHEAGTRHDTLDGRATTTVFYEHMEHRLAYTILPGRPADPPEDARIVHRDGLEIALSRDGGRDVAVFERGGRTCVLAGNVERTSTLVELAAWTGGGAVRS